MDLFPLFPLPSNEGSSVGGLRALQWTPPDYTSPPLPSALNATPPAFRSDEFIDAARDLDAQGLCFTSDDPLLCQIAFTPTYPSDVGVIFYGGALVDPRGYSPLAMMLAETYNMSVSIPIFAGDMAFKFGACESGRLGLAQEVFPNVTQWILAGHSFGGLAAFNDVWTMAGRNATDAIAGLALAGSYVRQDLMCGPVDFSGEQWNWLPMVSMSASEDKIVNMTNFEAGQAFMTDNVDKVVIEGGNHGQFGWYNYTLRTPLLGQVDGEASISHKEQQALMAAAIASLVMSDAAAIVVNDTSSDVDPTVKNVTAKEHTDGEHLSGETTDTDPSKDEPTDGEDIDGETADKDPTKNEAIDEDPNSSSAISLSSLFVTAAAALSIALCWGA